MFGRSSVLWLCCVLALLLGACASTDAGSGKPGAVEATTVVPRNYRQLIARYIAANVDRGKVLEAEISRPGVWESPIGLGEPRPLACARWRARGAIIKQTYTLGFTFENGKISDVFDPGYINPAAGGAFGAALKNAVTCGKLSYSPFPELLKMKRK